MSRFRRATSVIVLICFMLAVTDVANAQTPLAPAAPAAPAPQSADTMAAGLIDGEMLAEGQRTGGKLGLGLGLGVLTGLIGTGIGYFVIGPEPLSAEALQRSVGKGADYQLGLKTAWERKTKSKKRNAFLVGGLIGTAAFFGLVAATSE